MALVFTPVQNGHNGNGGATGTKRRRRSRRGEPVCAEPSLVALKLDAVGEPQRRRPRVGSSPRLQRQISPLCQPQLKPEVPTFIELPPAQPALDKEAALRAEVLEEEATRRAEEAARKAEETAREAEEADGKAKEAALLRSLKTVVITLERRPDRMQACAQRIAATCPDLQLELFPAVDGRTTPIGANLCTKAWDSTENVVYQRIRSERKGWDDLHTYHERVLDLSPGERGCAASHILAWRRCAASGSDSPLLVLEDDAAPMPDFGGILSRALAALPGDAGVLYLGYSQAAGWRRELSAELVESEYVWTTVAYLIWPAAARLLLSKLPVNQPVDNFMAQLCARGELKAYCIRPKIIRQSDAWNCGSDIRHSDEQYWGPDSDIIHSEVAPAPELPLDRAIPGATLDDGSSFWDLSGTQQEQVL